MKQCYHNQFFWFNIYFLSIFGVFLLSQEARGESKEHSFNQTYNQLSFEPVISFSQTASTSAKDLLEAGVKSQKSKVKNQKLQVRGQKLAQSSQLTLTRVTGVEVKPTDSGLELLLQTVAGSERLVPLILPEGNNLVIDILDATLGFSIRNGVTKINPARGIKQLNLTKIDDTSIRLTITGEKQAPTAEVIPSSQNLVLSINPQGTTVQQAPDEEIEVIATGEGEEDDYYVPEATTATGIDTPIKDTPLSIQVVPQQVLKDRNVTELGDALLPQLVEN
jgi:hypothetical protein